VSLGSRLISKPWGFEYRVNFSDELAIIQLNIFKGEKTSLHCHPYKTTSLVCLQGMGKINFLNSNIEFKPSDTFNVRNGLFHQIENIGKSNLIVLEFENPIDENDLIRFEDAYGRVGLPYESENMSQNDTSIVDDLLKNKLQLVDNLRLKIVEPSPCVNAINLTKNSSRVYTVLQGGLIDPVSNKKVLRLADSVSQKTLIRINNIFPFSRQTVLLEVSNESN